jgi:hypothetical protein
LTRRTSGWGGFILAVLVAGLIVALAYVNYRFAVRAPGGNDFLARWLPARAWLVEGVNPYDQSVSERSQVMIYGRLARREAGEDIAHFVYPLPAMIFFAPFAFFDFTTARALWMTLLELCLLGLALIGVSLAEWRPGKWMLASLVLFSVLWYHGFRAVIVGQFAPIEAVLMTGALLAVQRKRDMLAGLLLALSLAKPQMVFLLLPFILLWAASARRWSLILWTLGFSVGLFGASLAIMHDWPILWLRQVADYPSYTAIGSPLSIISGPFSFSDWLTRILSILLLVGLVVEWVLARGKDGLWFRWTAALTLVITNLMAFRTATTNYVVLIPALVLLLQIWVDRWGRRGEAAAVLTLVALFVGLWSLFLLTVQGNQESAAMYLPVPLFLLFGLWWTRWWATGRPRLSEAG